MNDFHYRVTEAVEMAQCAFLGHKYHHSSENIAAYRITDSKLIAKHFCYYSCLEIDHFNHRYVFPSSMGQTVKQKTSKHNN